MAAAAERPWLSRYLLSAGSKRYRAQIPIFGRTRVLDLRENHSVFVTNHVLSGVIIGQSIPKRPVTAFLLGLGSHLALDCCPHWGCDLKSPSGQNQFLRVAQRDGVLGLVAMATAIVSVERQARMATIAGMVGAVLLDMDKPFVHFLGFNPFPAVVDRIHKRVQNESIDGMRNELAYGMSFAAAGTVLTVLTRRRGRSIGSLSTLRWGERAKLATLSTDDST